MLHEDYISAGYTAKKSLRSPEIYRYYDNNDVMIAKTCSKCRLIKHTSEYYKSSSARMDGRKSRCIDCSKEISSRGYRERSIKNSARTPDQIEIDRARVRPTGAKKCKRCKYTKTLAEFPSDRGSTDGLSNECLTCGRERHKINSETIEGYYSTLDKNSRARNNKRTTKEIIVDREKAHPKGTKRCKKCRQEYSLCNFYSDRGEKDGLGHSCKSCHKKTTQDQRKSVAIQYWLNHNIPLECYVCGGPYDHIDHVIPLSLHGPDMPNNLLPMCSIHNSSKYNSPLDQWLYEKHPHLLEEVLRRVIFEYGVDPFPQV